MLLYLLVKICRFYHQNSVFVVLMLMFLSMGKNILRIYFVCVFQFEMMKPTRTRTQNIELTLYGLTITAMMLAVALFSVHLILQGEPPICMLSASTKWDDSSATNFSSEFVSNVLIKC